MVMAAEQSFAVAACMDLSRRRASSYWSAEQGFAVESTDRDNPGPGWSGGYAGWPVRSERYPAQLLNALTIAVHQAVGLGFHLLVLAHTLALARVLHGQKQRAELAIEARPAQLTPHRADRKAEGLARHCACARQQPAAVVAEHIEFGTSRAIGH